MAPKKTATRHRRRKEHTMATDTRNPNPNPYFDNLLELCKEHDVKIQAHEALKADLYRDEVSDDERSAWWARDQALRDAYPAKGGASKALRAWMYGTSDELELNDFLWDHEVHDFVRALKNAGLTTFTYTNQSSGVMENIHQLISEGCKLVGPCEVHRIEQRFGEETVETRLGLRFKVSGSR
jgi:hypothetical protein